MKYIFEFEVKEQLTKEDIQTIFDTLQTYKIPVDTMTVRTE